MAAAEVEEPGGFLEMKSCKRFVRESGERSTQFIELRRAPDTGKHLLANWADDGYLAIPDRFSERSDHKVLIAA